MQRILLILPFLILFASSSFSQDANKSKSDRIIENTAKHQLLKVSNAQDLKSRIIDTFSLASEGLLLECSTPITFTYEDGAGFVGGTNTYGDKAKGQRISIPESDGVISLLSVEAYFSEPTIVNDGNLVAELYALDTETNGPGTLITSGIPVKASEIMVPDEEGFIQPTIFNFEKTQLPTGDVFAFINYSALYDSEDQVSIYMTGDDCGDEEGAWEIWSDDSFNSFTDVYEANNTMWITMNLEINTDIACEVSGGVLEGGPFTFCVGDDTSDKIGEEEIILSNNSGENSQWVITDQDGVILGLPNSFADVDFDEAESGTCLVWHLSFDGELVGAALDANANDLEGCFNLSNPITVNRVASDDCNNSGGGNQTTVNLAAAKDATIFSEDENGSNGAGDLFVGRTNQPANRRALIQFDLSSIPENATIVSATLTLTGSKQSASSINAHRITADWGEGITMGMGNGGGIPSTAASNDATWSHGFLNTTAWASAGGDYIDQVSANSGISNNNIGTWDGDAIVSDIQKWISGTEENFGWILIGDEEANGSAVRIVSKEANSSESPSLQIVYTAEGEIACDAEGGDITGGPFSFCVEDGEADMIGEDEITLKGNVGENSQWVITDTLGNILGLPASFADVNFDDAPAGTCLVWHLSFDGELTGAAVEANASDLGGCFSLSNPITVNRVSGDDCPVTCEANAGTLTTDVTEIELSPDAVISATPAGDINIPDGYSSIFVLTSGSDLVIQQVNAEPTFTVTEEGLFTIHTLVYNGNEGDPNFLDLSIVDFGTTTGVDVLNLVGSAGICASLDAAGAPITVLPQVIETVEYTAILSGYQQNPSINSTASGSVTAALTGNTVVISGSFEGLMSGFNADIAGGAHIHEGLAGSNGGVVVPLVTTVGNDGTSGSFAAADNTFELSDEQVIIMQSRGFYINIHTVDIPSGELRGQILPSADAYVAARLAGENENDVASTEGSGMIIGEVNGTTLTLSGSFGNLTGEFDANVAGGIHIHTGTASMNGGILTPLSVVLDDNNLGGAVNAADNVYELTEEIVGILSSGGHYVNIHTTEVASGEIRGQLLAIDNAFPSSDFAINSPADGANVTIIADDTPFEAAWSASTDDTEIAYIWQLAADDAFSTVVFQTKTGTETTFATTMEVVDGLLESAGLTPGASITLYHRAVASDGSVSSAGGGASVNLTRMAEEVCEATAGTLTADAESVAIQDGSAMISATQADAPNVPDGYSILYVLTSGEDLVIQAVAETPMFTVEMPGLYTIHTLVYNGNADDPNFLDLSIVEFGTTTGGAVLGVVGEAGICAALDVTGAKVTVTEEVAVCEATAGTLTADAESVAIQDGGAMISATQADAPNVPDGYSILYVLTSGEDLVIQAVAETPMFTVEMPGLYTIHTLVYNGNADDPNFLDLSIVEFGTTTGGAVLGVVGQAGICAALDVAGAKINVTEEADVCEATAGTLTADAESVALIDGMAMIAAAQAEAPNVPDGYSIIYVLTSGDDLVIQAVSDAPAFTVDVAGSYTIHTLVYNGDTNDPNFLNLGIVEFGTTTGGDVLGVVTDAGICAALDVAGAPITVTEEACNVAGGTLEGGPFTFCVGDETPDMIGEDEITLTGNSGENSQWVITDSEGNILGLPASFADVNFDDAPAGTCLVWHLSFDGELTGAAVDANASDLGGCFDLSNPITVIRNQPEGGTLEGGPFTFCVGDDTPDMIGEDEITLTGNSGENSQWVITDSEGNILGLPASFADVNFDDAPAGTCLVWHLSFDGELTGAAIDANASDLGGCFDLSNPITVIRNQPEGGTLEGGPFTFCVGDETPDMIGEDEITLTGNSGENSQWVITDSEGNILGLPASFADVNFDDAPAGTCLVWHLSFDGELTGAAVDANASDLGGCFGLSNPITVIRNQPEGGTLEGGPFTFCVGDDTPDMIGEDEITLTGNSGENSQWVITDSEGNILGLPASFADVNFDDAPAGTCLVWHLSFDGELTGASIDANASDLGGCFDLSNPITVIRNHPEGGILEGGPFTFCVGDETPDMIGEDEITLTGNSGENSQWVITDSDGNILGLPASFADVNFDDAPAGTCLVWHLSFDGELTGAAVDANASNLGGCFSLSNPITVNRVSGDDCPFTCEANAGTLTADISEIELSPDAIISATPNGDINIPDGYSSIFVLTSGSELVIEQVNSEPSFTVTEEGLYTIHTLVYNGNEGDPNFLDLSIVDFGTTTGVDVLNLVGSAGICASLDAAGAPITVLGQACAAVGGTLEGGPFTFCVGDEMPDMIGEDEIALTGNSGENSQWVITDSEGNILGLPASFADVNFDDAPAGTCLVWHLSFDGELTGAAVDANASDLGGCFDLSNPITVIRNQPNGGTLEGGPFTFCVGDDTPDMIGEDEITLTGNSGENSQWVITDSEGNILGLPASFANVNFDDAPAGMCLVWHLSFDGELTGAAVDANASDLGGCFNLSNPITVNRVSGDDCPETCEANAGTLTADVSEIELSPDAVISATPNGDINIPAGYSSIFVLTSGSELVIEQVNSEPSFTVTEEGLYTIHTLVYNGNEADPNFLDLSIVDFGATTGVDVLNLVGSVGICASLDAAGAPITVIAQACAAVGGTLEGGPFTFCVGDETPDMIGEDEITLTGNSGENSQWVITDSEGNILGLPASFADVNFDDAPAGTCLVWHLSFDGELTGAAVDANASDLGGCFDLSNPITVIRNQPDGGTLEGGPFTFCVGDDTPDMIGEDEITLTVNSGENSQWVITDSEGNILGLPASFADVNFDDAPAGTCLVWHLSFDGELTGAAVDANASDLGGCFNLSNPITVNRVSGDDCPETCEANAGTLTADVSEIELSPDAVISATPNGDINIPDGYSSIFVLTSGSELVIEQVNSEPSFTVTEEGLYTIHTLVYNGNEADPNFLDLSIVDFGTTTGVDVLNLVGSAGICASLDAAGAPITVLAQACAAVGGTLEGGPFTFCVGDETPDMIGEDEITLTGNSAENSQWVITDSEGNILGLPASFADVNFDDAPDGTCLVWHLSFDGELTGAAVDANASDLAGCFDLSNPITVIRNQPDGGTLEGGPFTFCVGDDTPDMIGEDEITLTGNSGENSQWVITDSEGNILGLPASFADVNFDDAPAGTCLVWHLSFDGELTGAAVDANASDLGGCFSLSNPITVNRISDGDCDNNDGCDVDGGSITTASGFTNISFCVGDGRQDPFDTRLNDASGPNSTWVITSEDGTILGLQSSSRFNFESVGEGVCLVWHLSYQDNLTGAALGMNAADLGGCFDLSNPITVNRLNCNDVCHAPLNLRFINSAHNRVKVRWAKVALAVSYEVRIGYEGFPDSFTTIPTHSNKITLSYHSDRTLQVSVRAICRDGSVSEYSNILSYTPEFRGGAVTRSSNSSETRYGDFGVLESNVTLSPSPARNFLNISYDQGDHVDQISVWDVQGRRILDAVSDPRLFSQKIDISELNEGIFILTITFEGELLHSERFIKAN